MTQNQEERKNRRRKYYLKNKERIKANVRKYKKENIEKVKTQNEKYRKSQKCKDKIIEWKKDNPNYSKNYESKNREKINKRKREYRNKPEIKAKLKIQWKKINNSIKTKIRIKKWQEANKEKISKKRKEWKRNNKGLVNHISRVRNIKKLNQIPHFADMKLVKDFYINCPKGHHVDHIIPISKGGPHCIENLQYLTAKENLSKGNKMPKSISIELAYVCHRLLNKEVKVIDRF